MGKVSGYQNSRWIGSVGNVTFRRVRGRTIASEKIAERPLSTDATTRGPGVKAMSIRQMTFGLITRFAKNHEASINASFDKTKYGSQRNYFMKVNYVGLTAAFAELYAKIEENATDTMAITDAEIEQAVTDYATSNPTALYRIRKAGQETVYLTGAWDDTANPITAVVQLGNSTLSNGQTCVELATGAILRITGTGLSQGTLTLGIATDADGTPTDVAMNTALTSVTSNDTLITGQVASSQDGKYLFNIKLGGTTILNMVEDDSGQGTFG